jgi:hypothetical protein
VQPDIIVSCDGVVVRLHALREQEPAARSCRTQWRKLWDSPHRRWREQSILKQKRNAAKRYETQTPKRGILIGEKCHDVLWGAEHLGLNRSAPDHGNPRLHLFSWLLQYDPEQPFLVETPQVRAERF